MAAAALGAGGWITARRRREKLLSVPITGEWPELGTGVLWLLPDLVQARMVVPDRPHRKEETTDPALRKGIRRVREFTVTTGHERLRGGDPHRVQGRRRILCIGDSVTFGWGVAQEESWPSRLGEELARRGLEVEILNCGVPGLGLNGIAAYLGRVASRYDPDDVLICRRAAAVNGDPFGEYGRAVDMARGALPRARIQILLPPISRFDLTGQRLYPEEAPALRSRFPLIPVLELTEPMRLAQGPRGCALERDGDQVRLVRLETGETLLRAPSTERDLPPEIYARLEADPTVREALFFDDGHPDAEGLAVLAATIAATLG